MYKRCAVILCIMLCICMTVSAYAAPLSYKSTYVMAGFGNGLGGALTTGSDYGMLGGVIAGEIPLVQAGVRGYFNTSLNRYVVTYEFELAETPVSGRTLVCYIPLQAPITQYGSVAVSYTSVPGSLYGTVSAQTITQPVGMLKMFPFSTDSNETTELAEYVVPAFGDMYALPIVAPAASKTISVVFTIQDPHAEYAVPDLDFDDWLDYPFGLVLNSPINSMLAEFSSLPLVAPLIYLGVAAMLFILILTFLR